MEDSFELQLTLDLSVADGEAAASEDLDILSYDLPGYEVSHSIGRGSYGMVWAALQLATGQKVALKVLRSGPRQGLQRELQRVLAVSEHPHVVPLLDARLDGTPAFLVTPLMQGSMGAYIRQGSTPDSTLIRVWMKQVALALDYVHGRGIVHCDLKPDNILLDNEGNSRLCDFGQATLLSEGGLSLGTFFFMPPEQTILVKKDSAAVEPTYDIYALGATFYYLATGQHARDSETLRSLLNQERQPHRRLTLYREELAKINLIPCREANPHLEEDLAAVIERCLALNPLHRYRSAEEVVKALTPQANKKTFFSSLVLRWMVRDLRRVAETLEFVTILSWVELVTMPLVAILMVIMDK